MKGCIEALKASRLIFQGPMLFSRSDLDVGSRSFCVSRTSTADLSRGDVGPGAEEQNFTEGRRNQRRIQEFLKYSVSFCSSEVR